MPDPGCVLTTHCTKTTYPLTVDQYHARSRQARTMRAVLFDAPGPPSVLYVGEVDTPTVARNEVLIKVAATAINRADTLQRQGLYPVPVGE